MHKQSNGVDLSTASGSIFQTSLQLLLGCPKLSSSGFDLTSLTQKGSFPFNTINNSSF